MRKLALTLIALCAFCVANATQIPQDAKVIDMYSSPYCGCCGLWADYMRKNGYEVRSHKGAEFVEVKEKFGIKGELQSCHTGVIEVDGEKFALEGHLPIVAIEWLVANKPKDAIGISAPGMPQGSPGMEQGIYEEYPVVVLYKDGRSEELGIFKGEKIIKSDKIK